MQPSEWALLAISCFIGASSPGPSIALMIRAVMRDGRVAGICFALTHGFGIMLFAGMVATGLIAILLVAPAIMIGLQGLGVCFLIYVSQAMIRGGLSTRKQPADFRIEGGGSSLFDHGRDGFLIVFLNPKIAAFFLAIFSQFLSAEQTLTTRIGMTMVAWLIDTGWYLIMAFILALPVVIERLRRHHGTIEVAMGCLLMVAALAMTARMAISL